MTGKDTRSSLSDDPSAFEKAREILKNSDNIVFFGGAGVSTESGIPDFRSRDGIYSRPFAYPPERVLSRSFFLKHPDIFYDFYRERCLRPMLPALPNPAHVKLAEREREGQLRAVVTQNIDDLHGKAGSRNVLQLHGSACRNHCLACGKEYSLEQVLQQKGPARCACGGLVRPGIVLFEEPLDEDVIARAIRFIRAADVLLVAGSSMSVYPAAGLVDYFSGRHLILINRDVSGIDQRADIVLRGSVGEILGAM